MRRSQAFGVVVATVIALQPAYAEPAHADESPWVDQRPPDDAPIVTSPPPAPSSPKSISTARRIGAIGAAIVPGVVLRGTGSWVAGERQAARHLAMTALVGLGALTFGGLAVGGTNANPYFSAAGEPLLLVGGALFLPTWLADIWTAAGGERVRGRPRAPAPWSVELGTIWLHDAYRERGLARVAGDLQLGRLGLAAAGMLDAERNDQTGELEARWRIRGAPPTHRLIDDGSRLVVRAALRLHRDDADRVTVSTAEAELMARIDLAHLAPALDGTFVEASIGLGVERTAYPRDVDDTGSLLLGRFAWGTYLGGRGELAVFYDHRRDSMVGGLAAWRAAGFVGSFGASAEVLVGGPWAVRGQLEVGNAYVTTLAVRYQGGPR